MNQCFHHASIEELAGRLGYCLIGVIAFVGLAATSHGDSPSLKVTDLSGRTTSLAPELIERLPRQTVQSEVPHTDKKASYSGVLLADLLREAGIQVATASDRGLETPRSLRAAYVLVQAADGYQVVFSIPELHPRLGGRQVLLIDRKDGQLLDARSGPFQLVVPGSGSHERWVRQVQRISVRPATVSPPPAEATRAPGENSQEGRVYLVGTGPGDPDLITVKARRILQQAELVLCFDWMKDELAPFVQPGVVEVASPLLKGGRYFRYPKTEIPKELQNEVSAADAEFSRLKSRIAELTKQGKVVVFADNGDPMIFSPWGWLAETMSEFAIEVVPGLSSFNAANATIQRSVASLGSVIISSGAEIGSPDQDGRLASTVVFFTHQTKLPEILPRLQKVYPSDTPVVIVCDVSYAPQKVIHGTLGTIADVLGDDPLPQLYLFYVGDGLRAPAYCR